MKFSKITSAEYEVMKALWSRCPMTLGEIIEFLADETDWNPKTVQTLLGRLVKKNIVAAQKGSGRRYEYHPLVEERDYKRSVTQSLVSQVYDGKLSMLVSSMVEEEALGQNEIDELIHILNGDKK